jgi:hypothetical protein
MIAIGTKLIVSEPPLEELQIVLEELSLPLMLTKLSWLLIVEMNIICMEERPGGIEKNGKVKRY